MATATSTQWGEVFRETLPAFAASDVFSKQPVTIASTGDWLVVPVASSSVEPVGIARDDQAQGYSVTVYDGPGSIIRVIAGATVAQRQDIGVSGATNYAHPVSGNVATQTFYGPVSGASGSGVYRVGVALEEANPGQYFALRVNPKQLSGLA
jgi:hypothetical protein